MIERWFHVTFTRKAVVMVGTTADDLDEAMSQAAWMAMDCVSEDDWFAVDENPEVELAEYAP